MIDHQKSVKSWYITDDFTDFWWSIMSSSDSEWVQMIHDDFEWFCWVHMIYFEFWVIQISCFPLEQQSYFSLKKISSSFHPWQMSIYIIYRRIFLKGRKWVNLNLVEKYKCRNRNEGGRREYKSENERDLYFHSFSFPTFLAFELRI
jgi:hypothetical protein